LLWDEPLSVNAGDALRLDYRVVVHDGLWAAERCATEWERWTA
jgi:hypothetical protein